MQLDYDYVIGYESHAGEAPVLSIVVHDTPAPDGAGAEQIYESPPLRCDKAEKRHCYTDCPQKDQKDCYAPSASVDAVCEHCTGRYVSIRFSNNANNVQLLLPMSIEINQETLFISYITDFAALCGCLLYTSDAADE